MMVRLLWVVVRCSGSGAMTGSAQIDLNKLDGYVEDPNDEMKESLLEHYNMDDSGPFSAFASLSKVGFIPFNNNKVNQDKAGYTVDFQDSSDKAWFGVFDGHGLHGHEVSAFVAAQLAKELEKRKDLDKDVEGVTKAVFDEVQDDLADSSIECTFSGTTATCCYINGKTVYTANAGDSRAVLARKDAKGNWTAIALSEDHKPDTEEEAKRIADNGGRVQACKAQDGSDVGPKRVWLKTQDVPGLAMSRSFGDLLAASVGVISTPDVTKQELTDEDQLLILATDGLWEFISNQEAVDLIKGTKDPKSACEMLIKEATERWKKEEEVIDDITCLVVWLK
eukprot:TRINITY_DN55665_c0_g1_i2.p1 TRINITY_DN55665_c0_g1~~TRINITY_DN55665_c0_g1_i2.p1  ORF type:complete len:337 (-),score=193.33 TRINITY_DN55665_c0_g1_i2:164-1174(-)